VEVKQQGGKVRWRGQLVVCLVAVKLKLSLSGSRSEREVRIAAIAISLFRQQPQTRVSELVSKEFMFNIYQVRKDPLAMC